jgi:hypothetical protein
MDNGLEFFFLMKPASRGWLGFLLRVRKGFEIYRGFSTVEFAARKGGFAEVSDD